MIEYEDIVSLHIEASSHCNASCPVCPRNHHGGPVYPWFDKKHLTLEDHKKFFPAELAARQLLILYCGNLGDPSLNPELLEICQWWLSHRPTMAIQINTNAGTRDAKFWSDLGKLFVGTYCNVTFSVDGLEDTNHLYRRGVHWSNVKTAMESYIGSGGPAVWEFLVFKHNEHQVEEARELAMKMGFKSFFSKKAMGFAGANETRSIPVLKRDGTLDYHLYPTSNSELRNKAAVNERTSKAYVPEGDPIKVYDSFPPKEDLNLRLDSYTENKFNCSKIDCMANKGKQIYVSAMGNVYPCCFIGSRHFAPNKHNFTNRQIQTFLGNGNFSLHQRSLREIVEDDWFKNSYTSSWKKPTVREGKLAVCAEFCSADVTEMKEATSHRAKLGED